MTLKELILHFSHLYGPRNRLFLPGLVHRVAFLNIAIGDLQDAIRKHANGAHMGTMLARVVSRTFCITEYFGDLPLEVVMCRKYPQAKCTYCHKLNCRCPKQRPDYVLEPEPSDTQLNWSLTEWCEHFNNVYGERNRERGIENVLNRLFKEIAELLSLSMKLPAGFGKATAQEIEEEFAKELADTLAWTIAVANNLGIDLEAEVLKRYENGCWNCKQNPCSCTLFSMEPVEGAQTQLF